MFDHLFDCLPDQVYVQTYSIAVATAAPSYAPSYSRAPINPSQAPTLKPSSTPSWRPVYRLPDPPSRRPSSTPASPTAAPSARSEVPSLSPSTRATASLFGLPAFLTLNVIIFVSVGCFVLLLAVAALHRCRKSGSQQQGVRDNLKVDDDDTGKQAENDKPDSRAWQSSTERGSTADLESASVSFEWLYACPEPGVPEYQAPPMLTSASRMSAHT